MTAPARDDINDILAEFASAAPFRAATAEELTNETDPFRCPVRPDDFLTVLNYQLFVRMAYGRHRALGATTLGGSARLLPRKGAGATAHD